MQSIDSPKKRSRASAYPNVQQRTENTNQIANPRENHILTNSGT